MASQRRAAMVILGAMAGVSFLGTWARPTKRSRRQVESGSRVDVSVRVWRVED
jgi:hypothetical protein